MSVAAQIERNPLLAVSFTPREAHTLNGYSPVDRARLLSKNIQTYENEVLRDEAVSLVYEIDDWTACGFDPRERGGVFIEGFQKMRRLLRTHPGEAILWYSPPGPAAFSDDPANPFSEISFNYGQLYIQYYQDKKEKAVAVKIKNDDVVTQLLPDLAAFAGNLETEEQRIKFYINHPQTTGMTIDDFLAHGWVNDLVYTNNAGETNYLDDVLAEIRNKFSDTSTDRIDPEVIALAQNRLTENDIIRLYGASIMGELKRRGVSKLSLLGSCGGRTQTEEGIKELLGIANIFSTDHRLSFLSKDNDPKKDPNLCQCGKPNEAHFHCPGEENSCNHPIIVGEGTTKCPSCGTGKVC